MPTAPGEVHPLNPTVRGNGVEPVASKGMRLVGSLVAADLWLIPMHASGALIRRDTRKQVGQAFELGNFGR